MTKNKNCCNSTVRAFSQSTSRSNLEMSVWSSACQVDRSAPPWQWQRSHSESLETSRRLWSLESDSMVLANFALTTTIATLHTHTHTHPFNGPFSGTTGVSQYQKGKTNLDFTEAKIMGRMPFLLPNQQHQSTEGNSPCIVDQNWFVMAARNWSSRWFDDCWLGRVLRCSVYVGRGSQGASWPVRDRWTVYQLWVHGQRLHQPPWT